MIEPELPATDKDRVVFSLAILGILLAAYPFASPLFSTGFSIPPVSWEINLGMLFSVVLVLAAASVYSYAVHYVDPKSYGWMGAVGSGLYAMAILTPLLFGFAFLLSLTARLVVWYSAQVENLNGRGIAAWLSLVLGSFAVAAFVGFVPVLTHKLVFQTRLANARIMRREEARLLEKAAQILLSREPRGGNQVQAMCTTILANRLARFAVEDVRFSPGEKSDTVLENGKKMGVFVRSFVGRLESVKQNGMFALLGGEEVGIDEAAKTLEETRLLLDQWPAAKEPSFRDLFSFLAPKGKPGRSKAGRRKRRRVGQES